MRQFKNVLITGGCGFIGSNFIRYLLTKTDYTGHVVNVDKLTYAGRKENLVDIETNYLHRYTFYHADICDTSLMAKIIAEHNIDIVINFAAESFVDKAITSPESFITTNIFGVFSLLEAIKSCKDKREVILYQISTDEVYGEAPAPTKFKETSHYNPRNPYSASKAAADHLVYSYYHTHHIPLLISHCSNNYGPYQFPEKLIPLMISKILDQEKLPVYGQGLQIRDWIYVEDHCSAIWTIATTGKIGETYNVGGGTELANIELVTILCERMSKKLKHKDKDYFKHLITFVTDRPGHDFRYAINCLKLQKDLLWKKQYSFARGITETINWYIHNQDWITSIQATGEKK